VGETDQVANTLAYYDKEIITLVISFTVQPQGEIRKKKLTKSFLKYFERVISWQKG
jgi:hypothetical protein